VGVSAYFTGGTYNPPDTKLSDPAQAWLPPMEQTVTSALIAPFAPYGNTALNKHGAFIITAWATRNNTRVKIGSGTEQPLSGGTWYASPVGGMSFYDLPLESKTESYTITNPAGIIVMGYGTGEYESYYYLASSSMRTLDVSFYVNNIPYQNVASELFCTQPITFRAEIGGNMSTKAGHLKWYINDTLQTAAIDQLTWSKTLPDGVYQIRIEVLMDDDQTIRTEEAMITVGLPELDPLRDVILCADDTSPIISFTGTLMNEKTSTWEVISGNGTAIGLPANSGTLPIPAFKAINNGDAPVSAEIQITPIAANGCKGESKTFTVTVNHLFFLDTPKDIYLCPGESSGTLLFSGIGVNNAVWKVSDGSGRDIGMNAENGIGNIPDFMAINTADTAKTVTVTVSPKQPTPCGGESKSFTIMVYPQKPLDINLGIDTMICKFDSLLLNAGHPHATSCMWQDQSTGFIYTVYNQGGAYWVVISNRCSTASDTINISYFKELKINLGRDILFCEDEIVYKTLDATTIGASSYLWQDGSTSPTYIITQPGIYSVTVSNICMSVPDEVEVKFKDCRVLEVWIPNVFTPDEDGINDIFKPEINVPEYLTEYEMAIYNRWGNLLFITWNYLTGWNGKDSKNKECSIGVYTAVIKYKDNENRDFIKRSAVMLLR
jgi:gliding motility-associated-like protein